MAVILTYDDVFGRVQIAVTGLAATVTQVRVERSTNQVNWTYVRGATALTPVANATSVYDYEFSANVTNYYRVTGYYTGDPTVLSVGTASHTNNTSVVPGFPTGVVAGDLLLLWAAFRARDFGAPNAPLGYTVLANMGNSRLFGKIAAGATPGGVTTDTAPTVTFDGSVANSTCSAQMARVRGAAATTFFGLRSLGTLSSQNINYPAVDESADDVGLLVALGWKQDDWIDVLPLPGCTEFGDPSSTLGDDQGIAWQYLVTPPGPITISAGSFTVTGGAAARNVGGFVVVRSADQAMSVESSSITPELTTVWLKDVFRPFLNRTIDCIPNQSDITRRARSGIFDIVNRSFPVAVTDLHSSRSWSFEIITRTTTERYDLDLVLSTGDIFFIQAPPDDPTPTAYVVIQDVSARRPVRNRDCNRDPRVFTVPVVEVATPSAEISAVTGTWQTVINTYATWADVMAAHSSWASLLTLVGTVDEVLVP